VIAAIHFIFLNVKYKEDTKDNKGRSYQKFRKEITQPDPRWIEKLVERCAGMETVMMFWAFDETLTRASGRSFAVFSRPFRQEGQARIHSQPGLSDLCGGCPVLQRDSRDAGDDSPLQLGVLGTMRPGHRHELH
jgi:hypothetical protein